MHSTLELQEQLQAVERRLERERSAHSKMALASEKSRLQMELVRAAKGNPKGPANEAGPGDESGRLRRVRFGNSAGKAAGAAAQHAVSPEGRLPNEALCRASLAVVWKDQSDPLADTLNGRRRTGPADPSNRRSKQDIADARARKKSPERKVLRDQPPSARRPSTAGRSATEWRRLWETEIEVRAGSSEPTEPQFTKAAPPLCAVCAHRQDLGLKEDDPKMCAACLLYQPASTAVCSSRARTSSPVLRRLIDR